MKAQTILLLVMFGIITSKAQVQDIETKSVSINDMINFVAENYASQNEDDVEYNNITFAIQVANSTISTEDLVILKQAFKLLSQRLNEDSSVSIVTYFGFNGIALKQSSVSDLQSINKSLSNLKESIDSFKDDGIELAYQFAKANYDEEAKNTIVIVRNTNVLKVDATTMSKSEIKKIKRKKRNKAILTTAVGLLPELIALINK